LALAGALALGAFAYVPAAAEGDPRKGRELSIKYCARCHVVGDYNRMGGIGSTPSFQLLANRRPDFVERFQTFYQRRPHPVYVRVPDVPAWTDLPSYAAEFTISVEDIEDILAFAKTLKRD
jgi:mono/diheme cytochrome c family protein